MTMMNDSSGFHILRETITRDKMRAELLKPVGDVDLGRSPELRVELAQTQKTKPERIIVDLEQVPYMDSSGVATLVEAMQNARRKKTQLILCGMKDKVRAIFEIARLDMVFTIVGDCDDALNA